MAEEKFDVIIVGGGITGCVAAYLLAQAEMEVLVVERAEEAGQKAVTGGRMYGHAMEKIFPGFGEEERKLLQPSSMTMKRCANRRRQAIPFCAAIWIPGSQRKPRRRAPCSFMESAWTRS